MTEVTDGDILPDRQLEVAATRRDNEAAFDGRRPHDLAIDQTTDVFKNRIAIVAGPADGRVRLAPKTKLYGPFTPARRNSLIACATTAG